MVDDFKAYLTSISFDKIPRDTNKAIDATKTIGSLVVMPSSAS